MPAARQKETFETIVGETVAGDCDFNTVQAIHDELCGMIAEYEETKDPEPLTLSGEQVKTVLASCGVAEDKLAAFERKYEEEFAKTPRCVRRIWWTSSSLRYARRILSSR